MEVVGAGLDVARRGAVAAALRVVGLVTREFVGSNAMMLPVSRSTPWTSKSSVTGTIGFASAGTDPTIRVVTTRSRQKRSGSAAFFMVASLRTVAF